MAEEPLDLKGRVEVTAQDVINRLRGIIQPKGRKGLWLRHLSDRQLAEVYQRLKMGQSVWHVVQVVQKDWRIMKDSSTKSLCRALSSFKKQALGEIQTVIGEEKKTPDKKAVSERLLAKADRVVKKIDAMGRLRWLIDVQTERVIDLRDKELTMMPLKQTGKEVQILNELIQNYLDMAIRLGILDEKPTEVSLTLKHEFDRLLIGLPDDGVRVVAAADRFMALAARKSIKMVYDEEKEQYVPVLNTIPEDSCATPPE